jgi:hypothetical protein
MIDFREIRVTNCLYFRLPDEGSTNTMCIVRRVDYGSCCNGIGGYLRTRWDANYDRDASFDDSYYFPIPINEELLLSLGFKKEVDDIIKREYYRLRLNGFCIDINRYSNTLGRDYGLHIDNDCCDSVLSGDIQYLHQLQNYIYDATKQELDITNIL